MQQDVKYMVTFALATLERNWETDSANTGMMPKTDQLTIYSQHTYINTSTNLTRILKSYMKREFLSKAWKRITGRQIHLFIGYKSAYGTQYRIETLLLLALWSLRWPYCVKNETFTYSKDFIQEPYIISLLILPVRRFSVDTSFLCVFWTFPLWEIGSNFRILCSASTFDVFAEIIAL